MQDLISGAIVMGYLVAAIHFFKFWNRTADRLFGIFGSAFLLLALQRVALTLLADERTAHTYLYTARLLAFLLILWAIIDKNRATRRA